MRYNSNRRRPFFVATAARNESAAVAFWQRGGLVEVCLVLSRPPAVAFSLGGASVLTVVKANKTYICENGE